MGVRLQVQTSAQARYKGTWHCFKSIIRQERLQGLYRGMASPLAGVAFVNATIFGVYEGVLALQASHSNEPPTLDQVFVAGLATGAVSSLITCPMELAKIRLQNQLPESTATTTRRTPLLKGPLDCFIRTFRQGGIRACYRGMTPTVLRELSLGPYFVSYELFCRWLMPSDQPVDQISAWSLITAGGLAGITAWLSTYPADVVKTRMQDSVQTSRSLFGTWQIARQCYQEGGIRVFFRGLNATIVRAFPCNAATFFMYSMTMRLLDSDRYHTTARLTEVE
ncbi:hypothetical protein IWQ62_000174 [Dispira parvispora]|uniref:Uncharacterized protein n=1 Tax=Dispira parvispora TaxID=1520584 RepID=A0A9W8EAG6_9FUNG|nr:hypothetical protein IWQ62_000174 [Dispira parvispora]